MRFETILTFLIFMAMGAYSHENGGLPAVIDNDDETLDTANGARPDGGRVINDSTHGSAISWKTENVLDMGKSIVYGQHYRNQIGTASTASGGTYTEQLLEDRPILRPGEVEELVPGLIVTQHSGAGKANQFLLRGFNLDHGTDFATTVDGVPVNLPTQGHGQGYDDLNFVIPELIDHADYFKRTYNASEGDFSSAGGIDISYKKPVSRESPRRVSAILKFILPSRSAFGSA
jgi:hypothetical protein